MGGATETVSVDMSGTYIDWAERNFRVNKLSPNKNYLVEANVLEWITFQSELPAKRPSIRRRLHVIHLRRVLPTFEPALVARFVRPESKVSPP